MDETDVCNLALDLLREAPIANIDEKSSVAEWFQRNYAYLRKSTLRAYPWNFAIVRAELDADDTAPMFGWTYRYELPETCVRLLPIRYEGKLNGSPIAHEIESGFILTNETEPLQIRYVSDVESPDSWDPLFTQAFSALLALKMSHWLTGKASYVQIAKSLYDEALAEARRIDAQEGTPETVNSDDVISVRYA